MLQQDLLSRLDRAERELKLYTNKYKSPIALNRFKKFISHPLKVSYATLFRRGLLKTAERPMRMFWGTSLILPLWDEDAVLAYYTGTLGSAEIPLVRFLIRQLHLESVFYDIGANFGLYTALGEALGARVHSFEPNYRTAAYISANAKYGTTVNTLALSDSKGKAKFFEVATGRKMGMSSLFADMVPQTSSIQPREIIVDVTTLDEYVMHHASPTLIKMDVMNGDYLVLKGARELLTRHAPVLSIRMYNTPLAAGRSKETLSLLESYGYHSFKLHEDGTITPVTIELEKLGFASTFIFKKDTHE